MKKLFNIAVIIVLLIVLVGCGTKEKDNIKMIDDVNISIKEDSLTNTSMIIHIEEKEIKRVVYGESFIIEKKNKDKWEELDKINENIGFNSMAYYANYNGVLEMYQDWSKIYGKLDKGKYRLVKEVFYEEDTPITDEDKYYIYVEFNIK